MLAPSPAGPPVPFSVGPVGAVGPVAHAPFTGPGRPDGPPRPGISLTSIGVIAAVVGLTFGILAGGWLGRTVPGPEPEQSAVGAAPDSLTGAVAVALPSPLATEE